MILGTGIDLVEVARIANACAKFGDHFVDRILRPSEKAYCQSHRESAPFIAARYAAKEAISKAFGTGIGARLGWHDMEICREADGRPYVVLHGPGRELFAARGGRVLHLSLTHTGQYAAATAILES